MPKIIPEKELNATATRLCGKATRHQARRISDRQESLMGIRILEAHNEDHPGTLFSRFFFFWPYSL